MSLVSSDVDQVRICARSSSLLNEPMIVGSKYFADHRAKRRRSVKETETSRNAATPTVVSTFDGIYLSGLLGSCFGSIAVEFAASLMFKKGIVRKKGDVDSTGRSGGTRGSCETGGSEREGGRSQDAKRVSFIVCLDA